MRMPLFLCISSSDHHCMQPPIEANIMHHYFYMYSLAPMFWALIPLFILLTLLWAWVCPPRPYTCHTLYVSHPLLGTINTKPKATVVRTRKGHFSTCLSSLSTLPTSSCPHTLGGNLLTQNIAHLAMHGLNHIHTSFSYHISLSFDLHNYGLPSFSPKNGQKIHKRAKNPKKAKNPK